MLPYLNVEIDTGEIIDWRSFHRVFAKALGFPDFYGENMNAWIDCMTSLDCPDDGMSRVHAPESGVLVLELVGMRNFRARCPEIAEAVHECSAFVNWRRIEVGEPPVLMLSYR